MIVDKSCLFGENINKVIVHETWILVGKDNQFWRTAGEWMDIFVFVFVSGNWLVGI